MAGKANEEIKRLLGEERREVSQSTNFNEIVEAIQQLNPGVEIRIGNIELDPQANTRFYSSVPVEQLNLPDGFEFNGKNGITNKHNTKSGMYISLDVEDLSMAKESTLLHRKEEKNNPEKKEPKEKQSRPVGELSPEEIRFGVNNNNGRNTDDATGMSLDDYNRRLEIYKTAMDSYRDEFEKLGKLQLKFEDDPNEYPPYEEQALDIAKLYDGMKKEYDELMKLYNKINGNAGQGRSKKDIQKDIDGIKKSIEMIEKEIELCDDPEFELPGLQNTLAQYEQDLKRYEEELKNNKRGRADVQNDIDGIKRSIAMIEVEIEECDDPQFEGKDLENEKTRLYAQLNALEAELKEYPEPPEEPNKPGIIGENKKDGPENNKLPIKTGLQVFREQFNQMPEIKNKHTVTERLPLPLAIANGGTVLGLSLAAVSAPVAIAAIGGVAAASLVMKPILYRATGQRKIEGEIFEQFEELRKENPEEFQKMIEFLTEEKIQDLKPNAVILNALHKSMINKTKDEADRLAIELSACRQEREELLQKGTLTDDEQKRLTELSDRMKVIEEKEIPKVEKESKDVRRGKDRVSARYKGNLATRFNIFAHRNSTTEEYSKALNDLADAERMRDTGKVNGDAVYQARGQQAMEAVMHQNSRVDRFGVQKGVFNERKSACRHISDQQDKTAENVGKALTAIAFITNVYKNIRNIRATEKSNESAYQSAIDANNDKAKKINDISSQVDQVKGKSSSLLSATEAQQMSDETVAVTHAEGEAAAIHINGTSNGAEYRSADSAGLANTENVMNQQITGKKPGELIRALAGQLRKKAGSTSRDLSNVVKDSLADGRYSSFNEAAKHGEIYEVVQNVESGTNARADFYEKIADITDAVEELNIDKETTMSGSLQKIVLNPIALIIATKRAIDDAIEAHKEAKKEKEASKEKTEKKVRNIYIENVDEVLAENKYGEHADRRAAGHDEPEEIPNDEHDDR